MHHIEKINRQTGSRQDVFEPENLSFYLNISILFVVDALFWLTICMVQACKSMLILPSWQCFGSKKGSKSRALMQMLARNVLVVSAIWKVVYFERICDDWSLCWWISEIWRMLLSRKFIHNIPHASHFVQVYAPFIYKGDLSSTTIISFVSTTNWTNKTNSIVGVNERRRSPNQTNLAKSRDMLTLSDLFHSQNACVHCLV